METKVNAYDIGFKMLLSFSIFIGSMIYTTSTWANKPVNTSQVLNTTGSFNLAHYRRVGPYWGPRRVIYRPIYWGPWRPYWRAGVYCRKSCLVNRWGHVVRCRVRCY